MKLLLGSVLLACFLPCTAEAATVNASTCGKADVETALALIAAGDTLHVPGGSCTWGAGGAQPNGGIIINSPGYFKLEGVGAGTSAQCAVGGQTTYTCITDGTTKAVNPEQVLKFRAVTSGGVMEITGFTFLGGTGAVGSHGIIQFEGGTTGSLYIHHNRIVTTRVAGINVHGCINGLISDNDYVLAENFYAGYSKNGESCSGGSNGDGSWTTSVTFGTADALFYERNTYTTDTGATKFTLPHDGWSGARVVFRHNTITGAGFVTTHGTMQRERGVRSMEVYENTFTSASSAFNGAWQCVGIGSGTARIYNNTCNGPAYSFPVGLTINRVGAAYTVWGQCQGTNAWDGNTLGIGYPCIDQPGRGRGDTISGNGGPDYPSSLQVNVTRGNTGSASGSAAANPRQDAEPIYAWNNTLDGVVTSPTATASYIVLNRDYFTTDPGYTPYTYPHPLSGGSGASRFKGFLRAVRATGGVRTQ